MKAVLSTLLVFSHLFLFSENCAEKSFYGKYYECYVGKTLIVKDIPKKYRNSGYSGFYNNPIIHLTLKNDVYKKNSYNRRSNYKSLVGKKFYVEKVLRGNHFVSCILVLKDSDNNIVYYDYYARYEETFPFWIVHT